MALGRIGARLFDGDTVQPLLVGLAEADRHPRHAGRDHQQVGLHLDGQQRRRAVLVDDRLEPAQFAVRMRLDGDAAAAAGDDQHAFARRAAR
jgi:hypothetical protein